MTWVDLVFTGMAALFVMMTVSMLWHLRWVRRLPALRIAPVEEPPKPPALLTRCTVVVAARDEEARIEQTVRRLLSLRGVEVEIIVVNDRSTDRTGEILSRLAREDARLVAKRVEVLPEGWLGKCHACHIGASAATGEWILFTDADCWLTPDVLTRALQVADEAVADHITLTSGIGSGNTAQRASHLAFLMSMANWFSNVNRDRPKSYLGIGAFNLVRASAYRDCGGYETLRLTVLDDMRLGLLLHRAGRRTRGFMGAEDAECHWGTSLGNMMKVMEKNYFAALDYRLGLVMAGSLFVLIVFGIVAAGLTIQTPAGIAAALSPLLLALPAAVLSRKLGWSWSCALLVPFMFPSLFYMLLNSTFVTLRQGGVRWRDTLYPLDALRAGNVR